MLFNKKNLLSLYNALNGTTHTNVEKLEITTLKHAVDDCIKEGILADFLSKNRTETIAMSIFEYDEEKHMKSEREWAYKTGHEDGERRLAKLLQALMDADQNAEISRVLSDTTYREQLYQEHNL